MKKVFWKIYNYLWKKLKISTNVSIVLWPLNAQEGEFSHISLPLHRLLSKSIMLLRHYYFMRQKNVTQKFHLYSYPPCFIVFKKCAVGGGRKKLHARKKIYSKLLLLHFGSKNMVKENYCPNRILTNKLYLSIHCTMYISDAVITANCFLNIISIQRRGGGHFLPLGLPKCSGEGGNTPLTPLPS